MNEMKPSHGQEPSRASRRTGGPMWAMWICCLVPLLLFLIWSFFRR